MSTVTSFMAVLLMVLGQGRGDLLDFVPSADYWHAKGVVVSEASMLGELGKAGEAPDISKDLKDLGADEYKVRAAARARIEAKGVAVLEQLKAAAAAAKDPEVAATCVEIMSKLNGAGKAGAVRRLMAIRTLGELKAKGAAGALRELTKSDELFVADYAGRALAQIEGRPWEHKADAARREADVWLLPAGCGVVGQVNQGAGSMAAAALAGAVSDSTLKGLGMTREQASSAITAQVIQAAEMVGNVRLEGVTAGVSSEVTEQGIWVVVVAQGKFDPEAIGRVIELIPYQSLTRRMEGKVAVYDSAQNGDTAFLLEGTERLVMVTAPQKETTKAIEQAMLEAIKAGKGKLAESADLAALVKGADKTTPGWAVAKISESYRRAEVLLPFDTISASAVVKDGKILVKFEGQGKEKEKVAGAVDVVNTSVKTQVERFREMQKEQPTPAGMPPEMAARMEESRRQMMESIRPAIEVGETIKAVSVEAGAELTAEMKVELLQQLIGNEMGEMLQQSGGGRAGAATAPAGVEEEELVPARP